MLYSINTPLKADLPLLLELGLNEFICESNVETYIGQVNNAAYKIDVYVTCAPAQFWKFEIFCRESMERTVMETGSGSFAEYWPVAEMIGQNLITVSRKSGNLYQ